MFAKLHQRFGTAGLVVAVMALVVALAGTAIAAGGLTKSQEKQVKKIAKKYAGKNGKDGAPGATGAQGPKGDTGAPGAAGKDGTNGTNGTDGEDGRSVQIGTATVGECPDGGATVQKEGEPVSKKAVCNGKTGFTEFLPSGETETGAWGTFGTAAGPTATPISFNIPLEEAPEMKLVKEGKIGTENAAACPGYDEGVPTAEEGFLCIYVSNESGGVFELAFDPTQKEAAGTAKSGAVLLLLLNGSGPIFGTWAVTAE